MSSGEALRSCCAVHAKRRVVGDRDVRLVGVRGEAHEDEQQQVGDRLRKAMTDLSPDERAVLMPKTAGFSIDEIAGYYCKSRRPERDGSCSSQ